MYRATAHVLMAAAAIGLTAAACGGGDTAEDVDDAVNEVAEAVESGDEEAFEESVDDLIDAVEDEQAASGGGSATLTVRDTTYTFDSVLCAFGEDEIGQEGAEFVLSSIQDGTQFYVSIDSFGHSVSLDDIEDFENPSVSLSSFGGEFIQLSDRSVSGSTDFFDGTTDSAETVPGSFEATCP